MELEKKLDTSKIKEVLAQFAHYDPESSTWIPPPRTQKPKVDRRFFYDTLLKFRQAGHEVTWSNQHSRIELRFYDVPFVYWGFRRAAEALIERMKEWNNE